MRSKDFYELDDFTELEVGQTGANFTEVQFVTMKTLQFVRSYFGVKIDLIVNGLTTGKHVSEWHPKGLAVDFKFRTYVNPRLVVMVMILAGFKGIGVYKWGDGHYTFHGDLRPEFATWLKETNVFGVQRTYSLFNEMTK